ncbi:MAG: hypothetical protein GY798_24390, partial [Hyphomicrobiales bacterium]|nr:hypothetical protein [Hyphomicrobiales bacterium]
YDEIRPGCYDRDARVEDFALNWVDGSLRLSAQLLGRDNSVLVKNRRSAAGFGVALFGFCLSVRRG